MGRLNLYCVKGLYFSYKNIHIAQNKSRLPKGKRLWILC